jgi:monovalent cation/hydrogen antiporter
MFIFELVIALLLVGTILSLWARRLGIPYPALLALAGAILTLIPGVPIVTLDPGLALVLFVSPVLLDAAYDASPRDLRDNLAPVASLAFVVVCLTIAVVAWVAHAMVPTMSWAAAITLGAIVAPPDASAATAVLRQIGPPHRTLVILEGESLFNDAVALLVYRLAGAAAVSGGFSIWTAGPLFLLTCGGGVIIGFVLAHAFMWITARLREVAVMVVTQFISTFAVWLIADAIRVSPILAVVAYAMTVARHVPSRIGARRRFASYAVWEVTVFVLNVLAFVLIGLQLRDIRSRLEGSEWHTYAITALAVCAAVILVRVAWVMSYNAIYRWRVSRYGMRTPRPMTPPTLGSGILISWCGMRGIVTLATALALPDGAGAFPHRDLILVCAFSVVLATLVIQGLTLRPLIEHLGLRDDGLVEREIGLARAEIARVALATLHDEHGDSATILRREYEARLRSGERQQQSGVPVESSHTLADLQRRAVDAQWRRLMALRAEDVIGDEAFHVVEEDLDLLELSADPRVRALPGDSLATEAPSA